MTFQVNEQKDFVLEECINCGCVYAVTSQFQSMRKSDKRTFFCPNGHPQSYVKSEADKLREELISVKQKLANTEQTASHRLQAMYEIEGELEKAQKKLAAKKKAK